MKRDVYRKIAEETKMEDSAAWLNIPIGDWIILALHEEVDIQNPEDLLALVQKYSTADVARMAMALRHLGRSPETILPANKMLLEQGGRAAVSAAVSAQARMKAKTAKGKEEDVRTHVGPQEVFGGDKAGEDEETDGETQEQPTTWVSSLDPEGVRITTDYLLKRIPGLIRGRFKILAINGVPLGPIAETLKEKIDEMVVELKGLRPVN